MKLSNIKTVTMNIGGSNNGTRLAHHSRIGCVAALGVTLLAHGAYAVPGVTINSVAQRWPWNNKVDINYTVTGGQNVSEGKFYRLEFKAVINGVTNTIDGARIRGARTVDGTHNITWTAPSGVRPTTMEVFAEMYEAAIPSGDDYMIVDLDTGDISYEGLLATQSASNSRYNTVTYKTSKMAFRKVSAGTYYAKGKNWTTDRDYYIGIFMVTRAQYVKFGNALPTQIWSGSVTEENPLDLRPVNRLSFNNVRGRYDTGAIVPDASGSFLQRMNKKTSLTSDISGFDLPTSVMAFIAARAGTTTTYWWGDTMDTTKVCCKTSSGGAQTAVGTFPANEWGIFDAAGNGWEIALHLYGYPPWPDSGTGVKALKPYAQNASSTNYAATGGATPAVDSGFECDSIRGVEKDDRESLAAGFRVAFIAE